MMRQLCLVAMFLSTIGEGAAAQGLFRDVTPLEVTIVTELKALVRERDSTRVTPRPGTLTYSSGGTSKSFPVTLRARGHFRRQARNCAFPPIKLEFERKDARGTLFQGNDDLKITTNCRPGNAEFEQYVLSEYALYRAYQLVSPHFYRTRLARITYRDVANATPEVQSWAFFVEDDKEVAKRMGARVADDKGALFRDLDVPQLAITSLFEYMAGNTDWSIAGLHNVSIMRDTTRGDMQLVAYDFDWSGGVNARYAFPDARLKLRVVTDRLYRGPCLTPEQWQPVFARFSAAQAPITQMYEGIPSLDPGRRQTALSYLGDFWRKLANPRDARRMVTESCLPDGN
jgi:hypothetical protein